MIFTATLTVYLAQTSQATEIPLGSLLVVDSFTALYTITSHNEAIASARPSPHNRNGASTVEVPQIEPSTSFTLLQPEVVRVLRRVHKYPHIVCHHQCLLPALPQRPPTLDPLQVAVEANLVRDVWAG